MPWDPSGSTTTVVTMRDGRAVRCAVAALAVASAFPVARAEDTLFRSVRVFDGTKFLDATDVLVRDGRISAVGTRLEVRPGARLVDGAGRTLLPGLIDSHTHIRSRRDLEKSLSFGVTTDVSLNMDAKLAAVLKAEQASGTATRRADLVSAGYAATAPGGHGAEFGFAVPTLSTPGEAQRWVDARIAEGSDLIKIMYERGGDPSRPNAPALDERTMAALVAAAHERGRVAVVHIHTATQALEATTAGADGLAHLPLFGSAREMSAALRAVAAAKSFVIATLSVLRSVCGLDPGARLRDDRAVAAYLLPEDASALAKSIAKVPPSQCEGPIRAVATLRAAGVAILAGTDEPKPGIVPGASLHGEMEELVASGLSPVEALRTATSAPATAFRLLDRGRIAPGLRADLLLVDGDPARDVRASRRIVAIWKDGVEFDRGAWLTRAQSAAR